jgi:NAD+ synthase (glutamine-hydrolysing)
MKIALAQINSTVGDLEGNIKRMLSFVDRARESKAELLVFPESALTGNPLQDLLRRPDFLHACRYALDGFLIHTGGIGVLMGIPFPYLIRIGCKKVLF